MGDVSHSRVLFGLAALAAATFAAAGACSCGDDAAPAEAAAGTPCYVDVDCTPGSTCVFDVIGGAAIGECVAATLPAPKGDTYGAPCLSFDECAEAEECCQGICVGDGECTVDDPSTTPDVVQPDTVIPNQPECTDLEGCSPAEECCDGACVMRGRCDTNQLVVPTPTCSADAPCEVSEECCDGECVQRGHCPSNQVDPNPDSGSSACADRCELLDTCSQQVCSYPIVDVSACITACEDNPNSIPSGTTCAAVNADMCTEPTVALECDCGRSSGSSEPAVGSPCTNDSMCPEAYGYGFCVDAIDSSGNATGWTGGYCSIEDCWYDFECGDNGVCMDGSDSSYCLQGCTPGWDECPRAGYVCQPIGWIDAVCVPPCSSDDDCGRGSYCDYDGVCY